MKLVDLRISAAIMVVAGIFGSLAHAQSIQMSPEAFVESQSLPFAKPPALPILPKQEIVTPIAAMAETRNASASIVKTWRVQNEDVRLSTTIERWAKDSGHRLIWDAQKQVLLSAGDSFNGTLEEVLQRALSSPAIRKSDYPLEACFYPNNPPVIRITRLGEQTEECPE